MEGKVQERKHLLRRAARTPPRSPARPFPLAKEGRTRMLPQQQSRLITAQGRGSRSR